MDAVRSDRRVLNMEITRLEGICARFGVDNPIPKVELDVHLEAIKAIRQEYKSFVKKYSRVTNDDAEFDKEQASFIALHDVIDKLEMKLKRYQKPSAGTIVSKVLPLETEDAIEEHYLKKLANLSMEEKLKVRENKLKKKEEKLKKRIEKMREEKMQEEKTKKDKVREEEMNEEKIKEEILRDENLKENYTLKLESLKDMNILILGETGVGKSTWINGFINFLHFGSLQEAENEAEPFTLIASEFTVCDDHFNEITVSTGTDLNEVQSAGQSATQECKIYPFNIGGTTIRLIDTPGIGDTRGVDQDKKNFENIMSTLSELKELNGICILLKPNNSRLTVMFRFCIKELLTYLHKDASQNIMFCFTNSRGTFYRPGDTMPALKNLLTENYTVKIPIEKDTIYCYDSEAYRFLAAVKNKKQPVTFQPDERQNFVKSWEKSIQETQRMLQYINSLRPHPIQSTLNLNYARQLVIKMTRPLAETSKNIQTIREVIKNHVKEIKATNENIKELRKKRMYNKPSIKITKIEYPKTVCTNTNCVKIYGDEIKQTKYITVCHDICDLKNSVAADTLGDKGLLKCWAMNGTNNCRKCGHGYQEHLHCYYDSEDVMIQVENASVRETLEHKLSAAEVKKRMIEACEEDCEEYDYELEKIEKASAQFACFLKKNAITPYNDAMLEYMDHLIREEERKIDFGGKRETLDSLQKSRDSYKEEIKLLDEKMNGNKDDHSINAKEINDILNNLFSLKHNGQALKDALTAVNETHQRSYLQSTPYYLNLQKSKPDYKFYDLRRYILKHNW